MKKIFVILLLSVVYLTSSAITIYANKEDLSKYKKYGIYKENKFIKKHLLNDKWQMKVDGEGEFYDIYVPSAFDSLDTERTVIYKTDFFIPDGTEETKHYKLVFYGVNHSCNIKINGNFVENHNLGYNSFQIDLNNSILKYGETNELIIEVKNNLSLTKSLPVRINVPGWKNYGGIFREVYLVETSRTFVSDAYATYSFSSNYRNATLNISTQIRNYEILKFTDADSTQIKKNFYVYVEIFDPQREKIKTSLLKSTDSDQYTQTISFKEIINSPDMWAPNNPKLYYCSIYLTTTKDNPSEGIFNQYDFTFGFKDLNIISHDFYLNGEKFYVRGVSRTEDVKSMGNAVTYERMELEAEKIKNLGANLVISSYVPTHPYFLELCDRIGLFFIETIPVHSVPSEILSNENIKELAKNNLTAMVERDKNHPSVFAWSLGSGYNTKTDNSAEFIKYLSTLSKNITPSIFTTYSSKMPKSNNYFSITDFNLITIDCLESENTSNCIDDKDFGVPIICDGVGKRIEPDNENGFLDPRSEPSQAKFIINTINFIENQNNLDGYIVSSFSDRKTEVPLLDSYEKKSSNIISDGLIDYDGKNRISFITVESLFKGRKAPSLNQGDYEPESPSFFIILGLVSIIISAYMYRKQHYLKNNVIRAIKRSNAFYIDIRDRRISLDFQPAIIGFFSSIGVVSILSSILYTLRYSEKLDYLITHFIYSGAIKEIVVHLVWNPYLFVIVGIGLFFLILTIVSFIVKILAFFFTQKYSLSSSLSMVFWSSIVYMIFLPISVFFVNIINRTTVVGFLLLFIVVTLWFVIRIFQLMSVSFKTSIQTVIILSIVLSVAFSIITIYLLKYNFHIFEYMSYFFSTILQ